MIPLPLLEEPVIWNSEYRPEELVLYRLSGVYSFVSRYLHIVHICTMKTVA